MKKANIDWSMVKTANDLEKERLAVIAIAVRNKRNKMLDDLSKLIERHNSQSRLGIEPTNSIESLDIYAQDLRDITKQEGFPENVVWPVLME